ncbi:MAG: hypothetical protein Q8R98_24470 [Rubrivivax sp.]|nr:hypothetical protein [Rubrivivax sp.]MDZ4053442.1 hypothetical protein [Phenylobacterium sp.]
MSGPHHLPDSVRSGPTSDRDVTAFIDARRSHLASRYVARVHRIRLPFKPAVRRALYITLAWFGIAQWIGFVLRMARIGFGAS